MHDQSGKLGDELLALKFSGLIVGLLDPQGLMNGSFLKLIWDLVNKALPNKPYRVEASHYDEVRICLPSSFVSGRQATMSDAQTHPLPRPYMYGTFC